MTREKGIQLTNSRRELASMQMTEEQIVPTGVVNLILTYDNFDSINGLSSVPLISTLFNSVKIQKYVRFKKLLKAITKGNFEKVQAMIWDDPSLLLEKLDINDYVITPSGQKCNHITAYRTALACEDTSMANRIKYVLYQLTGNDRLANTQYREQLPEGWEAIETKRWNPIYTVLESLKNAIRDAKPDDITSSGDPEYMLTIKENSFVTTELTSFRKHLNARLEEEITTGRHFNPDLLLQAYQMYNDLYQKDFRSDSSDPRALLFWQQVIGTIQRALPVNYIQAFCAGLEKTIEALQVDVYQGRSLKIQIFDTARNNWVPTNLYPLSASRLGFEYAIYGVEPGIAGKYRGNGRIVTCECFQILCQTKAACMRALISLNFERISSFCSVS